MSFEALHCAKVLSPAKGNQYVPGRKPTVWAIKGKKRQTSPCSVVNDSVGRWKGMHCEVARGGWSMISTGEISVASVVMWWLNRTAVGKELSQKAELLIFG